LIVLLLLANQVLWTAPDARGKLKLVGCVWVLATVIVDLLFDLTDLEELGLLPKRSRQIGDYALFGFLVAGILMVVGLAFRLVHGPYLEQFLFHKSGYALVGFGQEFLLQSCLLRYLKRIMGTSNPRCSLLAAIIFSWCHRPNYYLMATTLAGGYLGCRVFKKHGNLYEVSTVHAIIGAAIASFIKINMKVGAGY